MDCTRAYHLPGYNPLLVVTFIDALVSSELIEKSLERLSQQLFIPLSSIFPVANYATERSRSQNKDLTFLRVLWAVRNRARDWKMLMGK